MAALQDAGSPIQPYQWAQWEELRRVEREVSGALLDLAQPAAEAVRESQGLAAADGVASAARLGRVAGVVQWTSPQVQAVEALAGFMADGSPLRSHFERLGPETLQDIRQALAGGIAAGDGAAEIAERIRAASGMSITRAETIARTEVNRAYREATRQSYAANADVLDGWVRVCSGDSRTCAACWALHGTRHSVQTPCATHPRCRCVMVPDVAGMDQSIPSADTLFGRMSESGQREALGPGRFEAWQAGAPLSGFGRVVDNPRWGPVAEVVPLVELGV